MGLPGFRSLHSWILKSSEHWQNLLYGQLSPAKGRTRVLGLFSRCVLGVKSLFMEVNNVILAANDKVELGKSAAEAPKPIPGRNRGFARRKPCRQEFIHHVQCRVKVGYMSILFAKISLKILFFPCEINLSSSVFCSSLLAISKILLLTAPHHH